MAIDKNSKAYQSLLKSGYSDDQISQMSGQVASGKSAKDVVANANSVNTTTATTTPTQATTSTPVVKSEYQGTGGSSIRPKDTSWDKGDGQYAYNPTSGYYEKVGESGTKIQTYTTPTTPTQTTTPANDNVTKIANGWNNMSYEQQQAALQKNPSLQQVLDKYGIGSKSAPAQNVTNQGQTTPKQDEWDYQDNSPERMLQMADNIERLYQTDPGLFTNEQTFRNFFINGKGRTPEQEAFLMDYYKNRQTYNKYDGVSAENAGNLLANGQLPQNYLNYVKNSNPDRYNAIMDAKDKAEDQIRADTALDTINSMTGDDTATITSKAIEWLKTQGLFVDKDGNLIDDRTENYASDEEKQYAKDAADIIARNLDIDNTVKHTYDDLVKAYPGATKATLMAMAQDINSDLLREKENNNVELTRLQGYMDYMQAERQERNRIGESSMKQLQEMYGMYYDYSPEGMSELVQNKYAATNITLDQADNGTDAQKQIALQSVLDGYYDKYGSIIQRSEAQVINDVMAYAKNNGVSLSQALEENFLKPLRAKPQFSLISSGKDATWTPDIVKIGDNGYYFDENGNLKSIGGGTAGTIGGSGAGTTFSNYTPISTEQKETIYQNFKNQHPEGSTGGECGSFVNDYLQSLGYGRWIGNDLSSKTAIKNSDEATVGSVAIMNSGKHPSNGHVAIVQDVQGDKVKLLESNWNDDHKVHTTRWENKSDIIGYFDPSKSNTSSGQLYNPNLVEKFKLWTGAKDKSTDQDRFWSMYGNEISDAGVSKEQFMQQYNEWYEEAQADAFLEILENLDNLIEITGEDFSKIERGEAFLRYSDIGDAYKFIKNNLTLNALADAKERGVNLGILSDSDVKMVADAASSLGVTNTQSKWNRNLNNFRERLLGQNKYLRERYKNKSAYSTNKTINYNPDTMTYTIGTSGSSQNKQKSKDIKTLGGTGKSFSSLTK